MPRKSLMYLDDIRRSIDLIDEYVAGVDERRYTTNQQLQDAVERRFLIVAEALSRLQAIEPALHARITATPQIRGFRNVVVHEYELVRSEEVFEIVRSHLPLLRREAAELLGEVEAEEAGRG